MNHYQLNTNWNKNSYKQLYTICNLYDLKGINEIIEKNSFTEWYVFFNERKYFPYLGKS